MSELISGKDALIALANGVDVDACVTFRLKKMNGIGLTLRT